MSELADLKVALDDMRARQLALVNLILFTDQKAIALFRLYVTIAIAAGATAAAGFFKTDALMQFTRWSLLTAAVMLAIGAFQCSRAMASTVITLPGRGADFWEWAIGASDDDILNAYIKEAMARQKNMRTVNERTAKTLANAVRLGVSTPVVAAIAGMVPIGANYLGYSFP